MNESEYEKYRNNIEKDITAISLLIEDYDYPNKAAFMTHSDRLQNVTDIYCGNPGALLTTYMASMLGVLSNSNEKTRLMEYFLKNLTDIENRAVSVVHVSEQLTEPSEGKKKIGECKSENIECKEDFIVSFLENHSSEGESWAMGFAEGFNYKTYTHGDPAEIMRSIALSLHRFMINQIVCPICGNKMGSSCFMEHFAEFVAKH